MRGLAKGGGALLAWVHTLPFLLPRAARCWVSCLSAKPVFTPLRSGIANTCLWGVMELSKIMSAERFTSCRPQEWLTVNDGCPSAHHSYELPQWPGAGLDS